MSNGEAGQSGGSVTLDQLVALNDEMAALVRAGIPLERGLIEAGRDLGGRLGAIAGELGGRLAEGERLPAALGRQAGRLPEVYRAIVEAGLRSGRLARALEGMAAIARGYAEARRAVGLALLYPLLVVLLAYALFLFFVTQIAPKFVVGFDSLRLAPVRPLVALAKAGEAVLYWGPIFPAALLILAIGWAISGRSTSLDGGAAGRLAGRIPGIGRMIGEFRSANFAELLALLVEHHVPLDEAVRLAADSSGDRAFRRSVGAFADRLRAGDASPESPAAGPGPLPPLLSWMLTAGHRQGTLALALRNASDVYRRRAQATADTLRAALPTFLMIAIGAGTVLLYGLVLFVPLSALWDELAVPTH